jgi:outer membrane receptor protein involved in Fe transport
MLHTVLLLATTMVFMADGAARITGLVLDAGGAPVQAEVHEGSVTGPVVATTDVRGQFSIEPGRLSTQTTTASGGSGAGSGSSGSAMQGVAAAAGPGIRLVVTAPGFAPAIVTVGSKIPSGGLRVVLEPASIAEQVTVTAGRRELRGTETPGATSVVTSADLLSSAALTADDALRQETPGFTLFRRSSSRAANPTTQGVTMRGLSASGASRTLVLAGGVPLNDPFGGWVYWGRVPQAAIERIEVVRGGMSDLYGADAVGGVIHIVPFETMRRSARGSFEAGSLDTNRVSVFAGTAFGRETGTGTGSGSSGAGGMRGMPWQFNIALERLSTEGAPIVAEEARGSIDTPAGLTHHTLFVTLAAQPTGGPALALRGQVFSEDRENGTPLQTNDTNQRQLAARLHGGLLGGTWQAQAYGAGQGYDQSFTSVAATRDSESLTQRQRVPSDMFGGGGEWLRTWSHTVVLVGADARRVTGTTVETRYVNNVVQAPTSAGGIQRTVAGFTQLTYDASSSVSIVGGVRVDRWENEGRFTARSQTRTPVSPRLAASWRVAPAVTVRGAVYRAFRSPTLNELYRNFRAGDTLTQANEDLASESLVGGDASVLWTPANSTLRATLFMSDLDHAVANVTLSTTPTLTTRQRQNAGKVQARGFELEAERRLTSQLVASGTFTATRSKFSTDVIPGLDGLDVPQVPRYAGAVSLRYVEPRWLTATLQVRGIGAQWEDDRNTLQLDRAGIVDLFASRHVTRGIHIFAAAENLLDAEVPVGRTPLPTIGLPRTMRFGVRAFWP